MKGKIIPWPMGNQWIFIYLFIYFIFFLFVGNFVIHWNETAMGLHVLPMPIPPPTSSPPDPSRSSQCTRSIKRKKKTNNNKKNMNLVVHLHQTYWEPDTLPVNSSILKGFFPPWVIRLNNQQKFFSKSCCQQMCFIQSFVIPQEQKKSRFTIIIKCLRIFEKVNDHWLQLKVT